MGKTKESSLNYKLHLYKLLCGKIKIVVFLLEYWNLIGYAKPYDPFTSSNISFQSKNITKSGVELIKVIKDKLVAEEGACSQPTVINTMHINLSACAERAFDIKAHKLLKGESVVMLPNARDLFPGQPFDENTVIDIKVQCKVMYK